MNITLADQLFGYVAFYGGVEGIIQMLEGKEVDSREVELIKLAFITSYNGLNPEFVRGAIIGIIASLKGIVDNTSMSFSVPALYHILIEMGVDLTEGNPL